MSHLDQSSLTETQRNLIKILEEKGTSSKSGWRLAEKESEALIVAAGSTVEEFTRVDTARNQIINAIHHVASEHALEHFNASPDNNDFSVEASLGQTVRYQDEYVRTHGEGDKQIYAHHRPVVSHNYEDMATRVATVTNLAKSLLG